MLFVFDVKDVNCPKLPPKSPAVNGPAILKLNSPKPVKPKLKLKSLVGTLTVAVEPEVIVVDAVAVPYVVVAFAN